MFFNHVIISIATIPRRMESSIWEVINTLKNQSIRCPIIINIPQHYKKWGACEIPQKLLNDPDITVWQPTQDYGPATKLLGALEYVQENTEVKYIITLDDDMLYENSKFIEFFLSVSLNFPKFALTTRGIKISKFPPKSPNDFDYNFSGFVDAPRGFAGVLYPVDAFKDNNLAFNLKQHLPKGVFNEDDAYFGIVLSKLKVPLLAIPLPHGLKGSESRGTSAVEEFVEKDRIENELEIYQIAFNQGLLPNLNGIKNQHGDYRFDLQANINRMTQIIDNLISSAIALKEIQNDTDTALTLMKEVQKYRPYNPEIKNMIESWNKENP